MNLTVNGKRTIISICPTVEYLVTTVAGFVDDCVVEVDGEFVPRSTWRHTRLREGQNVEVVSVVRAS